MVDLKTFSHLGRFTDIIGILLKYGFDDLVHRLDISFKGIMDRKPSVDAGLSTYERIRMILEELGPTFIKFGQILSVRPDLLPQPMIRELVKLQDKVAPVDFVRIRDLVEESLERPLEKVFTLFEQEPLAAASLSQVHRAVLREGGPVVAVKVQRPRIRPMVETDFAIMKGIAEQLHERFRELRIYDLPNLVKVSKRTLLREMDFRKEARYMKIARAHLGDMSDVYIPRVMEDYCTRSLLVMEYVPGTKLRYLDPGSLDDPDKLARRGLEMGVHQIFERGFFHADPHPGNVLLTEEGRLCLIDWGMIGRLTEEDRRDLMVLINALADKDSKKLMDTILKISVWKQEEISRRHLELDLLDLLDLYSAVPLAELDLGQMLLDITDTMREYHLGLPADLAVMIKSLITLEGIARQLSPDMDVISETEPLIQRIAAKRFGARGLWKQLSRSVSNLFTFQQELPGKLGRIIHKVEQGELRIHFEHENLQNLEKTLETTFNRLTFGIIIGAIVIGSSMIITTGIPPFLFGFPAFGIIGYLVSGLLGLWLVFNIIRHRNY